MIKAIETHYKGYRFRSRLEARWAIFLDTLGADWRYEPEGFVLDGTPYLPDFWLPLSKPWGARTHPLGLPPQPGFYLEVKPVELTAEEERLCRMLAIHSRHCVYAVAGNVGRDEFISYKWHPGNPENVCRQEKLSEVGLNNFLFYVVAEAAGNYEFDRLDAAFRAARSARFEHGENGKFKTKGQCMRCGRVAKPHSELCDVCASQLWDEDYRPKGASL